MKFTDGKEGKLRADYLRDNAIRIRRRPTDSPLIIKVEPEAMEIIRRYFHPDPNSLYLFPFIAEGRRDDYPRYQSALRCFNWLLEMWGILLGISVRLSSYPPRHSWATYTGFGFPGLFKHTKSLSIF